MRVMITISNLSKEYGSHRAVADLSFVVPDGTVTGFLGPNGSGKSTTMRCILGLDTPTSGSVLFDSQELSAHKNKSAVVGAMLDPLWGNPGHSGKNFLRILAYQSGVSSERVQECLEVVGLESAAGKKIGGYSLGMKQRLGLAAALLGNPRHLILDEPVNGLDPEGVKWMRTVIRRFAEEGRAVLVSSHLLSEMQLTADRLVVIGRGSLIGEYSMEDFLARGVSISIETSEERRLAFHLAEIGLEIKNIYQGGLCVCVPDDTDEGNVRRSIAEIALRERILIVGLKKEKVDLEKRFLELTRDSQEYEAISMAQ